MIEVSDLKMSYHNEAGNMITFRCPKCHEEIDIAESGWWRTVCSCGYRWHLVCYAYTKDDESEE